MHDANNGHRSGQAGSETSGLYVDAENVYYYLQNTFPGAAESPSDVLIELIRNVRAYAEERFNAPVRLAHAYADFEQIDTGMLGSLYLVGVDTHNVLGADHKNAADMRLCIDAMETLYKRPGIDTFVLVAGDRDYIPIVQHLRKEGKRVRVIAFRETLSGDLLQVLGHGNFTDAMSLLSKRTIGELGRARISPTSPRRASSEVRDQETDDGERPMNGETEGYVHPGTRPIDATDEAVHEFGSSGFADVERLDSDDLRRAIAILIDYFWRHEEVWMGPYLRRLSEEMTHLADYERKGIIATFQQYGLARAERRRGHPNDYSVLILNREHPDVLEAVSESRFADRP